MTPRIAHSTDETDDRPLIAVVGALSKQGRGVAAALLQSGRYRVRALTRRPDSPEAQRLAQLGATLAEVPLELGQKAAFVEAFRDARGAFLMTPGAPPDTFEIALGKEQADAAVAEGVQHVIFSSLENVRAITGGKKWAPHFTDKAVIEDYIRGLPLTSSFVQLALFYSNLLEYYPPRQENGKLTFSLYLPADVPIPFVDALAAAGPAVREMFDRPDAYSGRTLPVIGEMLTPNAMVATFIRVTGIDATYQPCYTRATLLKQFPAFAANEPFVRELLGMAEYIIEYGYYRPDRDLLWSRQIDPQTLTWESFLRQSAWRGEHQTFGVG